MPTARQDALQLAYERYRQLPVMRPLQAEGNPFVPGTGPVSAPVLLAGEAPGEKEAETGVPFAGPAGHLLDDLLVNAGMDRRMCWVTNVLKYRPPRNRTPYVYEIAASRECLFDEIRIINPVYVVTFGVIAFNALQPLLLDSELLVFGKRMGIPQDCSYPQDVNCSLKLLPLYHPAFLLRATDDEREKLENKTIKALSLLSVTGDPLT